MEENIPQIKKRLSNANIFGLLVIVIVSFIAQSTGNFFGAMLVLIIFACASVIIGTRMNKQIRQLKALGYLGKSITFYRTMAVFYVTGLAPAAVSLLIMNYLL